ncbi:MAG: hypothetical protein K6B15_02760 [Parasporobacterium sp.]|nr:hypothetical protein [Parasporobacterium sp.]
MVTFFTALAILLLGYILYGKFVERIFRPDERETPAGKIHDGVDFDILWRYFAWSNQTLAMIALWVASAALLFALLQKPKKKYA